MSNQTECVVVNLSGGLLVGLTLKSVAAFLSLSSDILAFTLLARKFVQSRHDPSIKFFATPLEVYILSLFTADFLQAFGSVMNVKWIHEERLYCSTYCTAQGTIEVLGETASAMATLAIAVHLFLNIAFLVSFKRLLIPSIIVGFIWLYVILYAGIAGGLQHPFQVPNTYWCWIRNTLSEELTAEYLWLWIAGLASIVLYIPLFFIIRNDMNKRERVPYGILLYPIAYTILVLPLSAIRWKGFAQHNTTDPSALFPVSAIFQLTGFVNVVLWLRLRGSLWRVEGGSGMTSVDEGEIAEMHHNGDARRSEHLDEHKLSSDNRMRQYRLEDDEAALPM